jgi:hypothetical protein
MPMVGIVTSARFYVRLGSHGRLLLSVGDVVRHAESLMCRLSDPRAYLTAMPT